MAKKHIVLCRICKQKFNIIGLDLDKDYIEPSKGHYYHTKCYEDWKISGPEKDEQWKDLIFDYIAHDLKKSYDYFKIENQRKNFVEKEKKGTNRGIWYTLKYYYEIKHGDWEKSNGGIGIVPYIYNEATQYWVDQENRNRGILYALEEQAKERQSMRVVVMQPTKKTKKQKWNLGDFND